MVGFADALRQAPALAAGERLLREIVIPGVHDHSQGDVRCKIAVKRRRLDIRAERLRHRFHDCFMMLEVFDELGRRRQIVANFVRHAGFRGEAAHKNAGRCRQGAGLPGKRQNARAKIGNNLAALQATPDSVDRFGCHHKTRVN